MKHNGMIDDSDDNIRKQIFDSIKLYGLIEEGDGVVVGFSGGADSSVLASVLNELSVQLEFNLVAVHINHMLRDEESNRDENFCREFCKKHRINFLSYKVDVSEVSKECGRSLEDSGRRERYRVFNEVGMDRFGAGNYKIAVAHNKNDLAETVLLNIIRGSGLEGLKGIDFIRGNIIRPMLGIERSEIEEYCRVNDIKYMIDSTNSDTTYTRNSIRHEAIAALEKAGRNNVVDKIFGMSMLIREDNDYLNLQAQKYLKSDEHFELYKFNALHSALKRRVLRLAILRLKGDMVDVESVHIDYVIKLATMGATGKKACLPNGLRAEIEYGKLMIYFDKVEGDCEVGGSLSCKVLDIEEVRDKDILFKYDIDSKVKYFDLDKFSERSPADDLPELKLRTREEGDIISPYKFSGTKKVKKYLIDKKVPVRKRNELLLVAYGKEIIWICGYTFSSKYICTEETKRVLEVEIN
jgi:tRNA(Ile)-lysidine synthase